MLRPDQEKWIAHLSDRETVSILPFDPTSEAKFEAVKKKIQVVFGDDFQVIHRGATSLGISGQNEIDVYLPVPESSFDAILLPLTALFGSPRSYYPRERARFVTIEAGKHIDLFLISKASRGWLEGCQFDDYLRSHPEALEQYRLLKEAGYGLSTREYYRRKIEFINAILAMGD